MLGRQGKAYRVPTDVGQLSQTPEHSQGLQHRGVNANAYSVIPLFDATQCWTAREGTVCHHFSGQTSPKASIAQVGAQLAEGLADANGGTVWSWHVVNYVFL